MQAISGDSPNLDFLRSVAVLCVFASHFLRDVHIANPGSLGRIGVIIFFVHTSLVLMGSLSRLESSGLSRWTHLAAAFWIRRFFRIYPLSIFCVLLVPIFHIPPDPGLQYVWPGWFHFASNLAIMQTLTYSPDMLGPLWSLPLEVQMYCLLPFAYLVIRNHTFRSLGLLLLAVASAFVMPRITGRLGVFSYAPCFTAGIMAYDLSRVIPKKLPAWLWPCLVGLAILLFGPFDDISLPEKIKRAWLVSALLGLAIPFCKELTAPWLKRCCHIVARYSYGIYLSHIIVFWLVMDVMRNQSVWLRAATMIGLSLGSPVAMYHFLEAPMIGVGARIARRVPTC